jgi:hypothetical protein
MKKKIIVTPEWVLEKLPHTYNVDGKGIISVYAGNATDANWIELALHSLHVFYESYDYLDDNHDFVFGIDFRIEDIKGGCPTLYKRMKELKTKNSIYNDLNSK